MSKKNMTESGKADSLVSSSELEPETDGGFHKRLSQILESEKNSADFAKRANISASGFHRLVHGGEPRLRNLIAIAETAGVSVEWLATGVGSRVLDANGEANEGTTTSETIDLELMQNIIQDFSRHLQSKDLWRESSPEEFSNLCTMIYRHVRDALDKAAISGQERTYAEICKVFYDVPK